MATVAETADAYVQLGGVILALALAARLTGRVGLSPVPLYLLVGLVLGSLDIPALEGDFVEVAAGLGVILLLLTIGLEYTAEELSLRLRRSRAWAGVDLVANATPGVGLGLLLGWDPVAALLLGGISWVSSSGIVAKTLTDLGRLRLPETPIVVSILVVEDLAMAAYLPLMASLLVGGGLLVGLTSVAIAGIAVAAALIGALRFGGALARVVAHDSEEVVLLSVLGLVLLAAGIAEQLQVSAAIGAFLVGIALSGEVAQRAHTLLLPLRDFNAALFFLFFGLQVDTGALRDVALPALALIVVTATTKALTGWWAASSEGLPPDARIRAAVSLIPRGEMSIVLAGLAAGAGIEPDLAPLAAGYVLVLAIAGPVLIRVAPAPRPLAEPEPGPEPGPVVPPPARSRRAAAP